MMPKATPVMSTPTRRAPRRLGRYFDESEMPGTGDVADDDAIKVSIARRASALPMPMTIYASLADGDMIADD